MFKNTSKYNYQKTISILNSCTSFDNGNIGFVGAESPYLFHCEQLAQNGTKQQILDLIQNKHPATRLYALKAFLYRWPGEWADHALPSFVSEKPVYTRQGCVNQTQLEGDISWSWVLDGKTWIVDKHQPIKITPQHWDQLLSLAVSASPNAISKILHKGSFTPESLPLLRDLSQMGLGAALTHLIQNGEDKDLEWVLNLTKQMKQNDPSLFYVYSGMTLRADPKFRPILKSHSQYLGDTRKEIAVAGYLAMAAQGRSFYRSLFNELATNNPHFSASLQTKITALRLFNRAEIINDLTLQPRNP